MIERNLIKKTKKELIYKVMSYKANCSRIQNLLIEYKADILLLTRRLELTQKKLEQWEEGHAKKTYVNLGRRHNRDIGALKRAHKRRRDRIRRNEEI